MNKESLMKIAKRENNLIRQYLLVNPLQGKHMPVSPGKALDLFLKLGNKVYTEFSSERILLIGFAETATAIGAAIAVNYPNDVFYIHTTREHNENWDCLYFSETHSHAAEQKLAVQNISNMIAEVDRIVFIEDEVTTGNTIINMVEAMQKRWPGFSLKYGIASLLNGMTEEQLLQFSQMGIPILFLERVNPMDDIACLSHYKYEKPVSFHDARPTAAVSSRVLLRHNAQTRTGVWAKDYLQECQYLSNCILRQLKGIDLNGENILVLGSEEFMFAPMFFANMLERHFPKSTVRFHAQTRSPILPSADDGYPLFSRCELTSLYDENRNTFLYNLKAYDRVILIHDSSQQNAKGILEIQAALEANGCKKLHIYQWRDTVKSSYSTDDVTLLLKDITGLVTPLSTEERERRIQNGAHYSTMLPLEYRPTAKYLEAYESALKNYAKATADAVCQLSEKLVMDKGRNLTIVSLARAGIPIGILIKRYIKNKYQWDTPHYALSIIRGRGIDKNAMDYILQNHEASSIQFIDGWIGKGAILHQLSEALADYPFVSPSLGVLSDPANMTELCGTHEDILIPSSCLNSTISGLLSRTFLREDKISQYDFHGACYYQDLKEQDVSYDFINAIISHFDYHTKPQHQPMGQSGLMETKSIGKHFSIHDIHLIKPGIGEATRVLLRRKPWKLLIWENGLQDPCLAHLIRLAAEKNVAVECYPLKNYKACGIIQTMADT